MGRGPPPGGCHLGAVDLAATECAAGTPPRATRHLLSPQGDAEAEISAVLGRVERIAVGGAAVKGTIRP